MLFHPKPQSCGRPGFSDCNSWKAFLCLEEKRSASDSLLACEDPAVGLEKAHGSVPPEAPLLRLQDFRTPIDRNKATLAPIELGGKIMLIIPQNLIMIASYLIQTAPSQSRSNQKNMRVASCVLVFEPVRFTSLNNPVFTSRPCRSRRTTALS